MKSLALLTATTALICGQVLAQTTPPSPSPSKPSPNEVRADCITAAKKAGLSGDEQENYVKQCISRGGTH
jgi:hypothetical protein